MAQPIVKYTLNKKGQVPEWINTSSSSFAGEHGINGNKTGYIPKYESPQDTIYLGIASGDPDPDGTPDDYVGIITTKSLLQTYITETGSTLQYKTVTPTITGIQTVTTTGFTTAFDQENYTGGLSTTTSTKYTASGVGTAVGVTTTSSTQINTRNVAGLESKDVIVTTSETTDYETSYDYASEATRLWDIYTALNSQ